MLCRCQLLSIALLLVAHTKTLEKMDGILTKVRFLLFSQRCIFEKHCYSAGFYAPESSVHNLCENCVLSYCYSSHIERRIDVWQLSVVHLATRSITHIVFYFSSWKLVGINVDRRYDHSVRTWRTRWKSDFGEKVEKVLKLVGFWIKTF